MIRVQKDRIQFDDYTLYATPTGFSFDGRIVASNFINLFQGTVSGYASGGYNGSAVGTIDKFPFATDTNATPVGNLSQTRFFGAAQSSKTHGFHSAGYNGSNVNTIDRFPFAVDENATDISDTTTSVRSHSGQSSTTHGYSSGGLTSVDSNVIDKFPFSVNQNATDVGDLTQARFGVAGHNSSVSGYVSGGLTYPPYTSRDTIDKFPFATDTNAVDVGNLSQARYYPGGVSSATNGYTVGGNLFFGSPPSASVNIIDKWPFAADTNATSIGTLSLQRSGLAGSSSNTNGYSSGGHYVPSYPGTYSNVIDKFSFFSDANATDIGDLTQARQSVGHQV
jgi:hypothetical protein